MQSDVVPPLIAVPWAQSGIKNSIPVTTLVPGAASLMAGFPAACFTPITSGGIPPSGGDFNGGLNLATAAAQWSQAGGFYKWDASFAGSIGGYPKGAILLNNTATSYWQNTTEENTTNPDEGGAGWAPFAGGVVNGPMFLDVIPIANATATWALTSMHGVATSLTQRAFMVDLGLTVATSGGTGPLGGNVALYAGVECLPGCGACWSFNPVLNVEAGAGANVQQFQCIEVDVNNNDVDCTGGAFLNGINITGAGTHIANVALGVYGNRSSDGGPAWLWGAFLGANNSVAVANIAMLGNALYGIDYDIFGGTASIRFANNNPVVVRNHAGTTDLQMFNSDTADVLHIGAGATGIVLGAPVIGQRWFEDDVAVNLSLGGGLGPYPLTHAPSGIYAALYGDGRRLNKASFTYTPSVATFTLVDVTPSDYEELIFEYAY